MDRVVQLKEEKTFSQKQVLGGGEPQAWGPRLPCCCERRGPGFGEGLPLVPRGPNQRLEDSQLYYLNSGVGVGEVQAARLAALFCTPGAVRAGRPRPGGCEWHQGEPRV